MDSLSRAGVEKKLADGGERLVDDDDVDDVCTRVSCSAGLMGS
jgi:hypothetical protein